ncbi:hypothetical protein [Spirosoma sp.]|uniref:hypothetical protein n=1 Tax=Spirosoma sp. TaxID=1899569 RepID=UPI003B3AD3DB
MHPVIKIIFYIALGVNGLVSALYFFGMLYSLFFPKLPNSVPENLAFLLISGTALGLLGWAYHLTIIQARVGTGFGMLTLAYLAWPILLVVAFISLPVTNWR